MNSQLQGDPRFAWVAPNFYQDFKQFASPPTDPLYGDQTTGPGQWYLNNTGHFGQNPSADVKSARGVGRDDGCPEGRHRGARRRDRARPPDLSQNIAINQEEIPSTIRDNLTDVDGDGIITFRDLSDPSGVNIGPGKVTDIDPDGAGPLLPDGKITPSEILQSTAAGGWADGKDSDNNGYIDDLCGWDFTASNGGDNNPGPDSANANDKHGTAVAGVAAATANNTSAPVAPDVNPIGGVGVAYDSRILPVRIFSNGAATTDANIASAILYAAGQTQNGAGTFRAGDIMNNSWGLSGNNHPAIVSAFQYATTNGRVSKVTMPSGPLCAANVPPGIPFGTGAADQTITNDLTVNGFAGPVQKVTVSVRIDHTADRDVKIELLAPPGSGPGGSTPSIVLANGVGSVNDNFGTTIGTTVNFTTFDDSAFRSISSGSAPFVGNWKPQNGASLNSTFNGINGNGTWTLRLTDTNLATDSGILKRWSITVQSAAHGEASFVAAGNDSFSNPEMSSGFGGVSFPANLSTTVPGVIAVGASTDQDRQAFYSNSGPELDFLAPSDGGFYGVITTDRTGSVAQPPPIPPVPNGTTRATTPTSMSSEGRRRPPLAAGIGALILSRDPTLSATAVLGLMRNTTDYIDPVGRATTA